MRNFLNRNPSITPGDTIAEMKAVSKSFNREPIIEEIDLNVKHGEFIVITGPSGSGKSTILRTLAGLERPDTGSVQFMGRDLYAMKEADRARLKARHMGVGFQAANLDTGLTVLDNMESLAEARGKVDRRRVARLVVALGLKEKIMKEDSTATLSGGEKQRVALGRLLVPKPDLVLLDEPTAAIDPHGKESIYSTLRELNEEDGTTFVVVSHDPVSLAYADRQIHVDSGIIVADQPPTPINPAA